MSVRSVDCIDEGGHLVRGTPDLVEEEARLALAEHYREQTTKGTYERDCFLGEAREADEQAAAGRCEIRLFRKIPCVCGGGHRWDMAAANERGRGVFTAAYLS